jgi:hypothetical protein
MLCACSVTTEPNSSDLFQNDEFQYLFAFDIINHDTENKEIKTNGEPIDLKVAYSNGEDANSFGLLLFVNGILQEYTLGGETHDMKIFDLSPKDYGVLNITFTPTIGKAGDTLDFYVCAVIKPDEELNPDDFIAFFDRQIFASMLRWQIISSADFGGNADTLKMLKTLDYSETDAENENIMAAFKLLPNDFEYIKSARGEKHEFTVQCIGGTEPKSYRVSFYINNELTPVFEGCSYMDIEIEPGQQAEFTFEIDTADFVDTTTFYAIAVPINGDDVDSVQKTNSLALFLSD